MIVKNEGPRLAACLASAREVAGEIVVVDTGSTDDTLAVAASFGAKISSFDFAVPDFSGARNQSLSRATGEWILVLDADELLAANAPPVVRALTGEGGRVGYVLQRRNVRPGSTEVLVDHAVRLFPNDPRYRYRGRVHETIDAAILANGGRIRTSHLAIDHLLPPDDGRALQKNLFYLSILDEELALDPDDVDRLSFRRAELHKLGRLDEATRMAERIVALAPGEAAHHRHLGLYRLVHQHDAEGAERAFREALALDPGDAAAREGLRCIGRRF